MLTMDGITQQICNYKVNGNSKNFRKKNIFMHWDQHRMNILLPVFLSSLGVHCPLLHSPPGYSFIHLLKPSMKIRQGSCACFSLFLHLKAGFPHCNFQSWKASITTSQMEPALRGICFSCLPLSRKYNFEEI